MAPSSSPNKREYFAYVLLCGDGTFYTGITTDLERRLLEHNTSARGAKYTRSRRPVSLTYHEPCADRSQALRREYALKQLEVRQKRLLRN